VSRVEIDSVGMSDQNNGELVNDVHRVVDALESIAASLEADCRDRRAQFEIVEILLREMVIRLAQARPVRPVVLGGSVDPDVRGVSPLRDIDIDLSDAPIPVDVHVEVRSRLHDHWVRGFAIAAYVSGPGHRGYRLRRLSDTEQLPLLFATADVRRAATSSDHAVLGPSEETRHAAWR